MALVYIGLLCHKRMWCNHRTCFYSTFNIQKNSSTLGLYPVVVFAMFWQKHKAKGQMRFPAGGSSPRTSCRIFCSTMPYSSYSASLRWTPISNGTVTCWQHRPNTSVIVHVFLKQFRFILESVYDSLFCVHPFEVGVPQTAQKTPPQPSDQLGEAFLYPANKTRLI